MLWPWAARKVKHMPPPTSRVSTRFSNASITPSLSDTLAPPSTATNGRSGRSNNRSRTSTSRARTRPAAEGKNSGWADDGSVRPVSGTKGVVNIKILALYQPGHERRVVMLLPGVKTKVLQELDALYIGSLGLHQFVQPAAYGCHRVPGVRPAFGPPEVATHSEPFGPLVEQPRQGLDGQSDTQVVGNNAAGHGDVEITADQDPLALDRPQLF